MENSIFKNNKVLLIALISAAVIILLLGGLLIRNNQQISALSDVMDYEKQELTRQYQELAFNFTDSLQTDNDSLNDLVVRQKQRIANMVEEIKLLKVNNASKIREYKKELDVMRTVLRSYVVQIDSLNQINIKLKEENSAYVEKLGITQNNLKTLEVEKAKLVKKVDLASKLETKNLVVMGLNSRDNETKKASRVAKIQLSFSIVKNISAPVGEKILYLRVADSSGQLLTESADNTFRFEGKNIGYSSQKSIEYGGEEMATSLFYSCIEGGLQAGKYQIDLFADGNQIGSASLLLK